MERLGECVAKIEPLLHNIVIKLSLNLLESKIV